MRSYFRPALAGLAVLAMAASGCGGSSSPSTARTRSTPLVSIFEAQSQLLSDPSGTIDQLKSLGVDVVRVFMPWNAVAPATRPPASAAASSAAYAAGAWAPFDAVVRAAAARGVRVYLTLEGGAPKWATGPGAPASAPGGGTYWRPSAPAFGGFVHAAGTRYSGHYTPSGASSPLPRVSFWSLWNEPNLGPQLAPQATQNSSVETSAGMYRALLDAGWSALHATGHGSDTILIGEVAPYGQTGPNAPGTFGEMVPLRFVRALYCVDDSLRPLQGSAAAARGCPTTASGSHAFAADHPGLFRATGFAVHPYPGPNHIPPNFVPPGSSDFANLAALPNLEKLLDKLTSTYGASKRLSLYSTEYGYFTDPPFAFGASLPDMASEYLNWAEYISWRDPRIVSWDQYLLTDPPGTGPSKFVTGLEFADGSVKPTYAAWRMPIYLPVTGQSSGKPLEVWGCARPAPYVQRDTGRTQQVQIELRAGSGGPFKPVRTVTLAPGSCYFDTTVQFSSAGAVRLAWSYPHGPTIHSREVRITAS